ncbi:MAG TPA: hypothetical protein VFG83_10095, partial [Kofleriaceae bacterium]|nr:hypothetical protein [Kofleriaceae bacterium]
VDDGYRAVGQTDDGLPKPDLHRVGADSDLVTTAAGPVILYQDATAHELRLAVQDDAGVWSHSAIAGDEDPFAGGYGFYISAVVSGNELAVATWVIDQPNSDNWVEILRMPATGTAPGTE